MGHQTDKRRAGVAPHMNNQPQGVVTHWAGSQKRVDQRMPICGDCGTNETVSMDAALCNCVFCLDWIRPNHDWNKTVEQPK